MFLPKILINSIDALSQSYVGEIMKNMRTEIISAVIASLLTAVILWAAGWIGRIPSVISVPKGAVVAFNQDSCPSGWSSFDLGIGRTIIGEGTAQGLSTRTLRQQGGAETHTLTISEMPSHDHEFVGDSVVRGGWGGRVTHNLAVGDQDDWETYSPSGTISNTGGGEPHNNMPPFIALKMCQKN